MDQKIKSDRNASFFKNFYILLQPYLKEETITFLCLLISSVISLLYPLIIKIIVDDVLINQNFRMLITMLIVYIMLFILGFVFTFLIDFMNSLNSEYISYSIKKRLYLHLQNTELKYLNEKMGMGEITTAYNSDISTISKFLSSSFLKIIQNLLSVIIIIVIMFMLNAKMAMFIVIVLPLYVLAVTVTRGPIKRAMSKKRELASHFNKFLQNVFMNIKILRLYNSSRFFLKKFFSYQNDMITAEVRTSVFQSIIIQCARFTGLLAIILIIWNGANMIFQNKMTIGGLMAFYTYMPLLFDPIRLLSQSTVEFRGFYIAVNKIFNFFNLPKEKDAKSHIKIKDGSIQFKQVQFSYNAENPVLNDISMDIRTGEKIALIGRNGCGKTTLINLLLKLYPLNNGEILIDRININDYNNRYLRRDIGVVTQDVNFFNLTIRDNFEIAKLNCTEDDVRYACALSGADEFIQELPDKYETVIGERGYNLSGGQLQKLSIARLIIKRPKIIIFDEATSSMDVGSIKNFYNLFLTVFKDCTVIFILHDLEKVTYADRIVLIKNGFIDKIYTKKQLLKKEEMLMSLMDEIM